NGSLEAIAEQTIQTVVRIYSVFRLTSQQDFELARGASFPGNFHPERLPRYDPAKNRFTHDPALRGVNRFPPPAYVDKGETGYDARRSGTPAFPGVTSYPQYSLRRMNIKNMWRMPDTYDAATWDGYLTLTNLVGVNTWHPDFICGFAHGSLAAYKV